MATIVRGAIPADELALSDTLAQLPKAEIECERIVQSGEDVIIPLLWFRYADRDDIDAALAADPTVDKVQCLSQFEAEFLYQMEWFDHVHLLHRMLTIGKATILEGYGRTDRWQFRILYPDRQHFARTCEYAEEEGLSFDITSIRDMEHESAGRFRLTEKQYEALIETANRGYYGVPRNVHLEDVATDLGISHQSLSERLRRALGALIEDALVLESFEEQK